MRSTKRAYKGVLKMMQQQIDFLAYLMCAAIFVPMVWGMVADFLETKDL